MYACVAAIRHAQVMLGSPGRHLSAPVTWGTQGDAHAAAFAAPHHLPCMLRHEQAQQQQIFLHTQSFPGQQDFLTY